MAARFDNAMKLMRSGDAQTQEDGFEMLRPHAREHLAELISQFTDEEDHGLRCWLLELIGLASDERALALLADQLNGPDALRFWPARGLKNLDTRDARRLLYQARSNGTID